MDTQVVTSNRIPGLFSSIPFVCYRATVLTCYKSKYSATSAFLDDL